MAARQDILVLGAGMAGTCAALELTLRGHAVTLVDRGTPGRETSYGNAGIIQREAVEPYAFPRDWRSVLSAALGRGPDVHYQWAGLLSAAPSLLRYWRASAPASHQRITQDYARLIEHATTEHARLMSQAGADDLVRREGFRFAYRSEAALQAACRRAEVLAQNHGLDYRALDGAAVARAEPALRAPFAGALHWLQPWTVRDPGALVERYARLFRQRGGRLLQGDARSLKAAGAGWQVATDDGPVVAAQAVVALGPWAGAFTRRLGYRLPLFVKRGYHRHYRDGAALDLPLLDAERGYVLAPMATGLRITTGAEIAGIDARHTPVQLDAAERVVRATLDLGRPVESTPWMGSRPCTADMKPVIGAAPRHPGLWFAFGHGHQGFTLGPAGGRLLADLMEKRRPYIDAAPFSPARF
ncbi:FAD-dependent oxidoreductase [Xylophilus sp. Kf1]|nr:FAD-dependent oxidoreductase [Xylophilus sp. Kf1]